jgi:hypothetical protein
MIHTEGAEVVALHLPDIAAFAKYVGSDCASTTWDTYVRRLYKTLGFPDGLPIPRQPEVGALAHCGLAPVLWHKAAIRSNGYAPILSLIGADGVHSSSAVAALKEAHAEAHGHALAPVFTHGVRKFTAVQQATLELLASPAMGEVVEQLGVDAFLKFLPAGDFVDVYGRADLERLINDGGLESVVPTKPSEVADSVLGAAMIDAYDALDDALVSALALPESVSRVAWVLSHDVADWSSADAPVAVAHSMQGENGAGGVADRSFEDVCLF